MANVANARPAATARPAPKNNKSDGLGWKMAIAAVSFVATVGGWAAVAGPQMAQAQQTTQASNVSNSTTSVNSSSNLPALPNSSFQQTTAPSVQPRPLTRTRSSR